MTFEVGVPTVAAKAREAATGNAPAVERMIAAPPPVGAAERGLQTRTLTVGRIGYGEWRGRYHATNAASVTAATQPGANVVTGPTPALSQGAATRDTAYAAANRAARTRAIPMRRPLAWRWPARAGHPRSGRQQGDRYLPPPASPCSTVQVDFALSPS